jgi:hypothetical protein
MGLTGTHGLNHMYTYNMIPTARPAHISHSTDEIKVYTEYTKSKCLNGIPTGRRDIALSIKYFCGRGKMTKTGSQFRYI